MKKDSIEVYSKTEPKRGTDGVWRSNPEELRRTFPLPIGPDLDEEKSKEIREGADYQATSYSGRHTKSEEHRSGYYVRVLTGPNAGKEYDMEVPENPRATLSALPGEQLDTARRVMRLERHTGGRRDGRFVF